MVILPSLGVESCVGISSSSSSSSSSTGQQLPVHIPVSPIQTSSDSVEIMTRLLGREGMGCWSCETFPFTFMFVVGGVRVEGRSGVSEVIGDVIGEEDVVEDEVDTFEVEEEEESQAGD